MKTMTMNKTKCTNKGIGHTRILATYKPETRRLADLIKTDPIRQKRQLPKDPSAWGVVKTN